MMHDALILRFCVLLCYTRQPPSVTSVVDDGIAYHAGVYPGDVIVNINDFVSPGFVV